MSIEYKRGPRCKFIARKKWYPFLVFQDGRDKSLSLIENESYSSNNIYVRRTHQGYYSFAVFGDAIELKKYIENFHPAFRCFDEIVVSEPQKPRFDIDIADTVGDLDSILQETIDYLLDALIEMIPDLSLEYNIRMYSSHGPNKRSLHLIVDGFFHDTHESAKGFYQRIIEYIPGNLVKYIDSGIYGTNKQLRIVSCCKWNDVRTKTLRESFKYHDDIIEIKWKELDNEVLRFISSLISVITNCVQLPSYAVEKKVVNSTTVDDVIVNAALELCGIILGENFTFEFTKTSGSFILLKRKSPSLCPTCGTIHEKEHPFLNILGVNVYFNCRRNRWGKSFYVGSIDNLSTLDRDKEIKIEEIEDANSETIRLGDKGKFIIRNKVKTVTPEHTKTAEPIVVKSKTAEAVVVRPNMMKSNDILNSLNSLNRSEKVKKPRRHKESESLSSIIDITAFL